MPVCFRPIRHWSQPSEGLGRPEEWATSTVSFGPVTLTKTRVSPLARPWAPLAGESGQPQAPSVVTRRAGVETPGKMGRREKRPGVLKVQGRGCLEVLGQILVDGTTWVRGRLGCDGGGLASSAGLPGWLFGLCFFGGGLAHTDLRAFLIKSSR